MSFSAKVFVFVLFTQVMQALMSYDGGATQMSTKALFNSGWSSLELGMLGAMDKFGQVATAFMWSNLLMNCNNKLLLSMGLFAKAGSCMSFGLLRGHWPMLGAKLSMGVSEALIGVWATVWVQANAPKDSQARWLGLASVSAGIGNGAGSAVAGFCSKPLGYAFAFVLQGAVLFVLWGIMVFTPASWFEFKSGMASGTNRAQELQGEGDVRRGGGGGGGSRESSSERSSTSEEDTSEQPRLYDRNRSSDLHLALRQEIAWSMSVQMDMMDSPLKLPDDDGLDEGDAASCMDRMRTVLASRLWLWTAMAISISCFITSAVAYMWQNTTESVWGFTDELATLSFLFTTGLGGLVGVALGPKLFDGYLQGFSTREGILRCLRWCTLLALMALVAGTAAALLFLDAAHHLAKYGTTQVWVLVSVLLGIFLVFALVNSMQGTLYGINTDATTPETRASAAALTVSLQNVIGFAAGTIVPSSVAQAVKYTFKHPEVESREMHGAQFSAGMAASLVALWPLALVLNLAFGEAQQRLRAASPRRATSPPPPVVLREFSDLTFGPL